MTFAEVEGLKSRTLAAPTYHFALATAGVRNVDIVDGDHGEQKVEGGSLKCHNLTMDKGSNAERSVLMMAGGRGRDIGQTKAMVFSTTEGWGGVGGGGEDQDPRCGCKRRKPSRPAKAERRRFESQSRAHRLLLRAVVVKTRKVRQRRARSGRPSSLHEDTELPTHETDPPSTVPF